MLNNRIERPQNVFSKKLLSTHYNYVNLQFYTSAAALMVQLPLMLYNNLGRWMAEGSTLSLELAFSLLVNGLFFHMQARRRNSGAILRNSFLTRVFFHMQSVMAYAVMGLISPVTQSVANTLKRALLIWLSIALLWQPGDVALGARHGESASPASSRTTTRGGTTRGARRRTRRSRARSRRARGGGRRRCERSCPTRPRRRRSTNGPANVSFACE